MPLLFPLFTAFHLVRRPNLLLKRQANYRMYGTCRSRSSLNCMIGYCRSFTMHVLKHHRGRSMLHVPVHRPVISTAGPAVDQLIGGKK